MVLASAFQFLKEERRYADDEIDRTFDLEAHDGLVYGVYGLTDDEIRIVEGANV